MINLFKENRSALISLVACLVLLGALVVLGGKALGPSDAPQVGTPMINVGNPIKEEELYSRSGIYTDVKSSLQSDDALSYGDFVEAYGKRRIQFDENCQATPLSSSFTVGDTLILDNRSSKIQAVKFVDDLYALPPYHVRVFRLERQGIFNIDCGTSKNVSEVIVH